LTEYDESLLKRSMLLGARIRFSPTGATARNQALIRIIKQALASANQSEGMTEEKLQRIVTLCGDTPLLRVSDVSLGLELLVKENLVEKNGEGLNAIYKLNNDVYRSIAINIQEADDLWTKIVHELFHPKPELNILYKQTFVNVLSVIFSTLSESNVKIILRQKDGYDAYDNEFLNQQISNCIKDVSAIDADIFRCGVKKFFKESTLDYDALKWNMAQNYYVIKALGIDPLTDILSQSVFDDSIMYCDTNVLIAGLTPNNRHFNSIKELANACSDLNIDLSATRLTLQELDFVINRHADDLKLTLEKVPSKTLPKVRDFLLEALRFEKEINPLATIDDIVEKFKKPLEKLGEVCNISEVDDLWFDTASQLDETVAIAKSLSDKHLKMRNRVKAKSVAEHDAILLLWVAKNNLTGVKSWIVTLDLTMAEWSTEQEIEGLNVVTLDAFLQWMTPISLKTANEETLASIFSSAINYQLLPVDVFFKPGDFRVFVDMGVETSQLPVEDIEDCIKEIKSVCPNLDPSRAEDREKINHIFQVFFADPSRKYQIAISEVKQQANDLSDRLKDEQHKNTELDQQLKRSESEWKERFAVTNSELNTAQNDIQQMQKTIQELAEAARLRDEEEKKNIRLEELKKLRSSTIDRLIISVTTGIVFNIGIFLIIYPIIPFDNAEHKVFAWLPFASAIIVGISRWWLGKKRVSILLKWNDPKTHVRKVE